MVGLYFQILYIIFSNEISSFQMQFLFHEYAKALHSMLKYKAKQNKTNFPSVR